MKKIIICMMTIPLQLLTGCFDYGQFGGPESFDLVEFDATEVVNRDTITLTIDKLATGNHTLEIYSAPVDNANFNQPHPPITVTYSVEMKQGKKIKEKTFSHILNWNTSHWGVFLYNIPKDFSWSRKGNLQITIKDISFGDAFTQYYKTINFSVKRQSLLFEHKKATEGY